MQNYGEIQGQIKTENQKTNRKRERKKDKQGELEERFLNKGQEKKGRGRENKKYPKRYMASQRERGRERE